MKTKKVIWERSGFEIPGVGMTKEGEKSRPLPMHQADELVTRGIAKNINVRTDKPDKIDRPIKKGGNG